MSKFWYDRLGRLVVSQNAKQAEEDNYSYTLYDQLGRITEVGRKNHTTAMTDATARSQGNLKDWLDHTYTSGGSTVMAEQVTQTVYDVRDPETGALSGEGFLLNEVFQKSYTLRNRVSYTRYYEQLKWNGAVTVVSDFDNSSTYSYDIHGNVDTLLHAYNTGLMNDHGNNKFKAIAYKYDLISGKVNEVHYQPGMPDQFYHRYEYDAENRLTDVYTADRKEYLGIPALEEHDARYSYYKHGPLAKTILGQKQVQGLDYAYTLQGWLKGVNSDSLVDEDGTGGSIVAKDAYRFSLNYFNGEYHAIGDAITEGIFKGHSGSIPSGDACRPLYNGNISSMVVGIPKLGETRLYNYGYDQLNRIVRMDAYTGYHPSTQEWDETLDNHSGEYKERISYDGNGNILAYLRNGNRDQVNMDSLHYNYNRDGSGYLTNNKLRQVRDEVSDDNYTVTDGTEDLDNQSDVDNYSYDAIGNLVSDTKEGISAIDWTVYGKIRKITKTDGTEITYTYDVSGNRISKAVKKDDVTTTTWYVRDAQGNTMAIYSGGTDGKLLLTEHHLYGSSRLGVWNRNIDMDVEPDPDNNIFVEGKKIFELSNHLGNNLVTITDSKIGIDLNSDGIIDYYEAEVANANDYYPFGMLMPGRKFSAGGLYRYGFNGKENDNEVKGEGNQQDYGMRIYDPRVGRFLSVDPITKDYPSLTSYQFASNNPVEGIDVDGLEYVSSKKVRIEVIKGKVLLKIENMTTVVKNLLTTYINDPNNWQPGHLGVDISIGNFNLKSTMVQQPNSDPDPSDANSKNRPGETEIGKPIANSTGLPDGRYKDRTVTTATPAGAKGLAIVSIAIDVVITGANLYIQNRIEKDEDMIKQHVGAFKDAAADVNYALQKGIIPKEYQTEEYLSDIINVVLSGTSIIKAKDEKTGSKLLEIGKNIYNTLSVKRNQYTGRLIETSRLDGVSNKVEEKNSNYDPNYVKENPPLDEK